MLVTTPSDASETYSCSLVPTASELASSIIALANKLQWTSVNVIASDHSTYKTHLADFIRKSATTPLMIRETAVIDGSDAVLTMTAKRLLAGKDCLTSSLYPFFSSSQNDDQC